MKRKIHWKTLTAVTAALAIFAAGALFGQMTKPESMIHVVTVKWNDDASAEQIAKALQGVETIAEKYDGVTRVWTRSIKAQGGESGVTAAFVMEFKDEQALKDYTDSDAQKEWYKIYLPVRDLSRTFDITN
jgi:uncharacterized protein (DUF1330 family)